MLKPQERDAWCKAVWSLALGIYAMALATSVGTAVGDAPSICRERLAVDYLQPFQHMPSVHPPPQSGELPFTPPAFRIYERGEGRILVDGGHIGYALSSKSRHKKVIRFDWIVTARVLRVNRKGRAQRLIRARRWSIGAVRNVRRLDFSLKVGAKPSLYRYEISFSTKNGRHIARYSQYARVVHRTSSVALRTSAPTFQAGDVAQVQIENRGTEPTSFGEGGIVSRFEGGIWVPALRIASKGRKNAFILQGGQIGPCEALPLPAEVSTGLYRVEKRVIPVLGGDPRVLTTEFQIVS